jgi:hypothetical protein
MKLQPKDRRVDRFLTRQLAGPAFRFEAVEDPRQRRGRRWKLVELLRAMLHGLLANCVSLRDVETLTSEQAERDRRPRRVPDTTLYELLPRLAVDGFRVALRKLAYSLWRSKSIEPVGLPCGVLTFDGKGIGTLDHDAAGSAQKAHRSHDGSPYWLPRVLRAVLTSSPVRPCLDQMTVPPETNERGAFDAFFASVLAAFGVLFEILTLDAGFAARELAGRIVAAGKAYVIGLKENQPELLREARRLLVPLASSTTPEAQTAWEKTKGKQVRRSLWRTMEMEGWNGWDHLRQVWFVRQETRDAEGRITVEERFFLTNLRKGRLSPWQILLVVRGHWGIENDCFGTLDLRWHEDDRPFCTQGHAVEVLGLLRMLAYNLLRVLRTRHLRERTSDGTPRPPHPWRDLFRWVRNALCLRPAPTAAT